MIDRELHQQIEAELANAEAARQDGLEGRARVCARRAAGMALRAYARQQGLNLSGPSVYDLLTSLVDVSGIPEDARQAAIRLTERVDIHFSLPDDVDLISEARRLIAALYVDNLPGDHPR